MRAAPTAIEAGERGQLTIKDPIKDQSKPVGVRAASGMDLRKNRSGSEPAFQPCTLFY